MLDSFSVYKIQVHKKDFDILKSEFSTYPCNDDLLFVYYDDEVFGDDIPENLSPTTKAFIYKWEQEAECFGEDCWICFEVLY